MDVQLLVEGLVWLGTAAGAGVVGNRADSALGTATLWVKDRLGRAPEPAWSDVATAEIVAGELVELTSDNSDLEIFVGAIAAARVEHPEISYVQGDQFNQTFNGSVGKV